jgi:hypothetical protein
MKSLWWFYLNLPLCKSLPPNYDAIRETCPAIIREKVTDLVSLLNNNLHSFTNINPNRVGGFKGSGRILRKAFSSNFNAHSRSFDESVDTNNNGFRRSTSTMSLSTLRNVHLQFMVHREA